MTISDWIYDVIKYIYDSERKSYHAMLHKIFSNQINIVPFSSSTIDDKGFMHVHGDFGTESYPIIGSGSYGEVAYMNRYSKIHPNSALKRLVIPNTKRAKIQFQNWIIEHVIQYAVDKAYTYNTHSKEYAAIQHPVSSLFYVGMTKSEKNISLLSGMFILNKASASASMAMVLHIATALDYIHSHSQNFGFRFMHRDLHFENIMTFISSQRPQIPIIFNGPEDISIVQDCRKKHSHEICFPCRKRDTRYDRYTFIDFGMSWLEHINSGLVLSPLNSVYATKHTFNDQHDLRQLIVSLYMALCVEFNNDTLEYSLKLTANNLGLINIIETASRTSTRFQLCTDTRIMTLIHRYVKFNTDQGITHFKNILHLDRHHKNIHALLSEHVAFSHTAIRINDMYKAMFNAFVQSCIKGQQLEFYHLMYAYMIEHHGTPIFKPSNLVQHILAQSCNRNMNFIIVKTV